MAEPGFTFSGDVAPICEVGMSDVAQAEPDSWLDVSCYVHEAELVHGRDRFNDRFQPGTATVTFSNDTGWADLVGDYAAVELIQLRPGRQIRVGVRGPFDGGPVVTRWLWRGYIDQATPAYDPVAHDIVTVSCIDAFGEAGMRQLLGGPLVGVNEAVHTRINRVLDARGWWSAKRAIATGTALMQGTTLQGAAADLMTQPADSAGGIVYGDLDGNVAYKDVDWELYDPDIPPDGEIGNCAPGQAPSGGTPPYLNPVEVPVYHTELDLPQHPAVTHFCVGQGADPAQAEGVIIERGEAYTISVDKPPGVPAGGTYQPHMYLTENGHTYDLGEWPVDGGCTTITHPTTITPPTRLDDPKPDEPPPTTITGIEIPAEDLFGVELLGYSDAGIADGPQSSVTVAGITPGPDRLLVVLVCALCNAISAGSLTPFPVAGGSITGGGVSFDEIGREPSGGNGAESYGAAGRTGRLDPGTFDVTVDWSGTNQSREHIVTVWGVTAERADLLDRMKFGGYLRTFTWDRTVAPFPTPNPPGKGAWATAFEDTASDNLPYPRLQDITVAQTLAESPTGPFGADFDTTDGEWWTPGFAESALRDVAPWSDDFERADAADLGPNWIIGPGPGYADTVHALAISSGAAVATVDIGSGGFYDANSMHWHEAQGANQVIEIEVNPVGYCYLLTQANGVDRACQFADFQFGVTGQIAIATDHFDADGNGSSTPGSAIVAWSGPAPVRLRLESDADGTQRVFVDDVLAFTWLDPAPVAGSFVGMGIDHNPADPVARILRAAGSSLGGVIVRKCSWVAGYRGDASAPDVRFDEVNYGPDNIQSCQACVVVEPLWPDQFGWRALAHYEQAPTPPATLAPSSHSSTVRYERNSILVVFVSAFAAGTAGLSVASSHGLTFHEAVAQGPVAPSHGQGAVFWAKTPELALAADDPDVITVTWTTTLDAVNYLIEEVSNGGTVAAVASAVRGTHTLGSVDGGVTVVLSPAPPTSSLVLGFLGVAGQPNAAGVIGGADFVEEIQILPAGEWTYLQEQSRVGSTSNLVNWVDQNASSTATASDAVALAVEVTPGPNYVNWETEGPLVIGGNQDAFNGPIYSAEERNADGTIIWSFNPGDYV